MDIIGAIFNIDIWQVGKFFVLIGLFIYLIFSFVVVRQVKLMTQVVSGILTNSLRAISWIFFLFSLFIFIFVLLFF
ncbi:hypothetical protein C4578_00150 [Candidatus Microgenomates bacterium]|jgi:uncharacterized membrane protein|nr:MAG: hypothetical protein C4578_00150 [Candidatus Microgenomates bacterium]